MRRGEWRAVQSVWDRTRSSADRNVCPSELTEMLFI